MTPLLLRGETRFSYYFVRNRSTYARIITEYTIVTPYSLTNKRASLHIRNFKVQ